MRRVHDSGPTLQAVGTFRVSHGSSRLARWLVRLMGMPHAGAAVRVELVVSRNEAGEAWWRSFDGRPLRSFQYQTPRGLLGERVGPFEIHFQLTVTAGELRFRTRGAGIRLGPLFIPLPRWCAPRVSAQESSTGSYNDFRVTVEVTAPLLGLLLAYEGTMTILEAQP